MIKSPSSLNLDVSIVCGCFTKNSKITHLKCKSDQTSCIYIGPSYEGTEKIEKWVYRQRIATKMTSRINFYIKGGGIRWRDEVERDIDPTGLCKSRSDSVKILTFAYIIINVTLLSVTFVTPYHWNEYRG